MRYAVIEGNVVTNVVIWDGEDGWAAPAGATLVQTDSAGPGYIYDGETFTAPPAPAPAPDVKAAKLAMFQALEAQAAGSANALLSKYPAFLDSLNDGNWSIATGQLDQAAADGNLNADQRQAIADACAANYVPVS